MEAPSTRPGRTLPRWTWALALVVVLAGGAYLLAGTGWFAENSVEPVVGAQVRRGPLSIAIVARGDLVAADSVDLRSEVEGRTTILSLVPEGSRVAAGDLVCELDATNLIERRFQQSIAVRNAEAAHVKAKQNYQIQQSQNRSDLAKATQTLAFAELDLTKFLEGERASELDKAKQAIELAKEDATRARTKLDWSMKLAERGFLTHSELETDRIANHRSDVVLLQAERALDLLERFQMPRRESELRAAREEAKFERERVELQAAARIVDFEADLATNEAKLGLENEKLAKLEAQIAKAKIRAPRAGLVVYAQLDSDEPPIQEGTEVRERKVILSIPNAGGMKAQAKLHESVLEQVALGRSCKIVVEALPGREFTGKVVFMALLPDQNTRWSNPNSRLYRTDVAIDASSADMRPGMSCSIKISVEEIPDTLFVPAQAVFREQDAIVCYVAQPSGYVVRSVTIGRYNVEHVQIVAGLAEGETVLLSRPPGRADAEQGAKPEAEWKPGAQPDGTPAGPAAPASSLEKSD
jgi:HlyD family secretion protein